MSTEPNPFKPFSKASQNRQKLFTLLQADITKPHSLEDLTVATSLPRAEVYASARVLCLKGFASRKDKIDIVIKGEKSVQKRVIFIQGRDPWGKKEALW